MKFPGKPLKDVVGTVSADTIKDPASSQVIRAGEWKGDGLLGELAREIIELEEAATQYGFDESDRYHKKICDRREAVFARLKQIQTAIETAEKAQV